MTNIVDIRVAPDMRYELFYNGTSQKLIVDGIAEGGHLEYCKYTDLPPTDVKEYSKSIPTAIDAGTYAIAYITVADKDGFVSDNIVRTLKSYILKANNFLLTEPKTHDFVYDDEYHELCERIRCSAGDVKYYINGESKTYDNPPMKSAPGSYQIWFSVSETDNYYGIDNTYIGTSVISRTSTCFDKKPEAVSGLRFTGFEQTLCTDGIVKWGGTIRYAVRTPGNYPDDDKEYSEELPKAMYPGEYEVWYRMYNEQGFVITTDYAADGINENQFYVNSRCLPVHIDRAETAYIKKPSAANKLVYDGKKKTLAIQG